MVQNIFPTSSASLKKGNSNFKCGMNTHRIACIFKTNYYGTVNFKLNY